MITMKLELLDSNGTVFATWQWQSPQDRPSQATIDAIAQDHGEDYTMAYSGSQEG